jgi:hypothetical protein
VCSVYGYNVQVLFMWVVCMGTSSVNAGSGCGQCACVCVCVDSV